MRTWIYRAAACLGLAVTLAGPLSGVARAYDDHDRGRRDEHQWREGWNRRPDVYYTAPPVVYPPYGYYQQPGATLSFTFPFR